MICFKVIDVHTHNTVMTTIIIMHFQVVGAEMRIKGGVNISYTVERIGMACRTVSERLQQNGL